MTAAADSWVFIGGPLDGLRAKPGWSFVERFELPTGDSYEARAFANGTGGLMLHREPDLIGRAPTRPLTIAEIESLRRMQSSGSDSPLLLEQTLEDRMLAVLGTPAGIEAVRRAVETPREALSCRKCGAVLLFSARARGNELCGPCDRKQACSDEACEACVRAVARWASTNGRGHPPSWHYACRLLSVIVGGGGWPITPADLHAARTVLGDERCARVYDAYLSSAPCLKPCGNEACGPSGGECQIGCPR